MKKKIFIYSISVCMIFLLWNGCVDAAGYKLIETMPGVGKAGETVDFPKYITGLYNFAIAFSVVSALLMVTLGGFYYIASAGNQAQAGTAKTLIKDALIGMVMVFLTWLVLHEINPDLLKAVPDLSGIRKSAQSSAMKSATSNAITKSTTYCTPTDNKCYKSLSTCSDSAGEEQSCVPVQANFQDNLQQYIKQLDGGWKAISNEEAQSLCEENLCKSSSEIKADYYATPLAEIETKNELKSAGVGINDGVSVNKLPTATTEAVKDITKNTGISGLEIVKGTESSGYGSNTNKVDVMVDDGGDIDQMNSDTKKLANKMKDDAFLIGGPLKTADGQTVTAYAYAAGHPLAGQRFDVVEQSGSTRISIYGEKITPPAENYNSVDILSDVGAIQ